MTEAPQELQETVVQEAVVMEDAIIELLSSLWTMYDQLPVLHPLDKPAFQAAIHNAQAIILSRPKIRGIMMARQGIEPMQQSSSGQPTVIQTGKIPVPPGQKAAAVPIHGTGGTKTLPGV